MENGPSTRYCGGMSDVTQLLMQIDQGDAQAAEKLLPLIYDELRKLAAAKLAQEKPGQTLQATAVVHEAYLRLVGNQKSVEGSEGSKKWDGRGHFFAAAAEAMRRILVENARRKGRLRRGGDRERVILEDVPDEDERDTETILEIDEALTQLAAEDPTATAVVKLHFFAGLTLDATAEALGMSRATAYRHWAYARAWLKSKLPDCR
jgi:RNA polymerase sigma factor (TIGR02999 family)